MNDEDKCYNMIPYLEAKGICVAGMTYQEIKELYTTNKIKDAPLHKV